MFSDVLLFRGVACHLAKPEACVLDCHSLHTAESQPATGLAPSRRVQKLLEQLKSFMAEHVYAAEHLLEVHSSATGGHHDSGHE